MGLSSDHSPIGDFGHFQPFYGKCQILGQFRAVMSPKQLQTPELKRVIWAGGASDAIIEFSKKKRIFKTCLKQKTVKKMKFSAFKKFWGAILGAMMAVWASAPQIDNEVYEFLPCGICETNIFYF